MSCKTIYVMISSFLSEEEKMIVAAHELGHIILHPELMSFKLYSLTKRGQAYHMPMEIQSNFLAK